MDVIRRRQRRVSDPILFPIHVRRRPGDNVISVIYSENQGERGGGGGGRLAAEEATWMDAVREEECGGRGGGGVGEKTCHQRI